MSSDKKILFIGCGKMGSAIIKNLLNNGLKYPQFSIIKPSKNNMIAGIKYFSKYQELPANYQPDIVVFGFKPQVAQEIISDFVKYKIFHPKTVFVSILAGKKVSFFEEILGKESRIITLMPNLPTLINEGIFGYFCNEAITKPELNSLASFLNGIGENILVKDEKEIETITAISGGGPAYLFLFVKAMIEASINLGLSFEDSKKLVKQTIYGSAKIILDSNLDPEDLIKSVASKGGTTQAALDVLKENDQLQELVLKAVKSATKRAKELSK